MISIVIPCRNEAANLTCLIGEVSAAMCGRDHEIIVIDDGSEDGTGNLLATLPEFAARTLRIIRHDSPAGQSAALRTGVFAARGDITVTMDGDGQNDPVYLPLLVDALLVNGDRIGIAAGRRLKRTDTRLNNSPRDLPTGYAKQSSATERVIRDAASRRSRPICPATAFLRWMASLSAGPCASRGPGRRPGRRRRPLAPTREINYGILDRGLRGVLDLFGVWWLRRRRRKIPIVTEQVP